MNIYFLQHDAAEGVGALSDWAKSRGHQLRGTRLFADEALPPLASFDFLIVLGGPMNVYQWEKYPWLKRETAFIGDAISDGKIVLGLCLGAQLIAAASGGKVTRNRETEIGWFPVELTGDGAREASPLSFLPRAFEALHWHGDTFSIPPNATHLARSAACEHQAFMLGERVLGLQFHLEFTPDGARVLAPTETPWPTGEFVQSPDEMLSAPQRFTEANAHFFTLLDRLVKSPRRDADAATD